MIKRWLIFWAEVLSFVALVALAGLIYIKPHMQAAFTNIPQDRLGLEVEIDGFYFSPKGWMEGRKLKLSSKKDAATPLRCTIGRITLRPSEPLHVTIRKEFENFDWDKLAYTIEIEDLELVSGNNVQTHISKVTMLYRHERKEKEKKKPIWYQGIQRLTIDRSVVLKPTDMTLHSVEVFKEEDEWLGSVLGRWKETPFDLSFESTQGKAGVWIFGGEFDLPEAELNYQYRVSGPIRPVGTWNILLKDKQKNSIALDLSKEKGKTVTGTFQVLLDALQLPKLQGAPIRGKLSGAFRAEGKNASFIINADDLSGGPKNTNKLDLSITGNVHDDILTIDKASVAEADIWSGNVRLSFDIKNKKPRSLSLDFRDFPLTQYSPSFSGSLSGNGQLVGENLKVKVFSDLLHPDKDPLNNMQNFQFEIGITEKEVRFATSHIRGSKTNAVTAAIAVERPLRNPMQSKKAKWLSFQSNSDLFELSLKEPVDISMSLKGMDVPAFELVDRHGRLQQAKGKAHIPFLNARALLIHAAAELNLDKFPPIAGSEMSGVIKVQNAVWDTGWALRNLKADLKGTGLTITPQIVFPKITKISVDGKVANSTLYFSEIEGAGEPKANVRVHGSYHMFKRHLDMTVNAKDLYFEDPGTFNLEYDFENLSIKGDIFALKMVGKLNLSSFRYFKPMTLFKSEDDAKKTPVQPVDRTESRHTIDLKVANSKSLEFTNNAAKFSFDIPNLRVHGPMFSPAWHGLIASTTDPANTATLPLDPLNLSFGIKTAQLRFNEDVSWDPVLYLQGEKLVDDVAIQIVLDDRLSQLTDKNLQLRSGSSYTREELFRMVTTGKKIEKTDIKSSNPLDEEGGGKIDAPSVAIKDPFPMMPKGDFIIYRDEEEIRIQRDFIISERLKAGISSIANSFEVNLKYKLNSMLDLELSQRQDEDLFAGFRFSKRVATIKDLFEKTKRVQTKKPDNHRVIWKLNGLPNSGFLANTKQFDLEIAGIESDLKNRKFDLARKNIKSTLIQQLHRLGFMEAKVSAPVIERHTHSIERRGGQRRRVFHKTRVEVNIDKGHRYLLTETNLLGWPNEVPVFSDIWLTSKRSRLLVCNLDHEKDFQNKGKAHLANHGYPMAQIEIVPSTLRGQYEHVSFKHYDSTKHVKASSDPKRLRGNENFLHKRIRLDAVVNPGMKYTVEQLVIRGVDDEKRENIRKVMGYEDGKLYCQNDFLRYQQNILKWYENNHYIGTTASYKILISRRYPRSCIHLDIKEGVRWKVGKIHFKGLKRTRESYLLKRIKLKHGDQASREKFKRSEEILHQLGIFEKVEIKISDTNDPKIKDVHINVIESAYISTSFKLGYESFEGVQGSWRGRIENIAGAGRFISLEGNFNRRENLQRLSYTDPFFANHDLIGLVSLARKRELISVQDIRNDSYLFQTGVSKRWDEKYRQTLSLIYQEDRLDRDIVNANLQQNVQVPSLRLRLLTIRRSSTNALAPRAGFQMKIDQSLISYFFSTNAYSYRGDYTLSYGIRLGNALIFPWHRWGHNLKFGTSFDVPLADRAFLGGTDSLRGFKDDDIAGPNLIGGESHLSMGLQLFYPLAKKVEASVFYEAGQVYESRAKWSASQLEDSAGFGILVRTPVGPLQVYYGHPIGRKFGRLGFSWGLSSSINICFIDIYLIHFSADWGFEGKSSDVVNQGLNLS